MGIRTVHVHNPPRPVVILPDLVEQPAAAAAGVEIPLLLAPEIPIPKPMPPKQTDSPSKRNQQNQNNSATTTTITPDKNKPKAARKNNAKSKNTTYKSRSRRKNTPSKSETTTVQEVVAVVETTPVVVVVAAPPPLPPSIPKTPPPPPATSSAKTNAKGQPTKKSTKRKQTKGKAVVMELSHNYEIEKVGKVSNTNSNVESWLVSSGNGGKVVEKAGKVRKEANSKDATEKEKGKKPNASLPPPPPSKVATPPPMQLPLSQASQMQSQKGDTSTKSKPKKEKVVSPAPPPQSDATKTVPVISTSSLIEIKAEPVANAKPTSKKARNRKGVGVRIMMERTNKILERSRNCKKQARKKPPVLVKPRLLPARASARLFGRKTSGDREHSMSLSDRPLRTVELIKRPLEDRDPATKLLYLASLSLYPKTDPECDSSPIVLISEEIPNPGGKRPKIRSLELPLLPKFRGAIGSILIPQNRSPSFSPVSISPKQDAVPVSPEERIDRPTKSTKNKSKAKKEEEVVSTEIVSAIKTELVVPNGEEKVKAAPQKKKRNRPAPPSQSNIPIIEGSETVKPVVQNPDMQKPIVQTKNKKSKPLPLELDSSAKKVKLDGTMKKSQEADITNDHVPSQKLLSILIPPVTTGIENAAGNNNYPSIVGLTISTAPIPPPIVTSVTNEKKFVPRHDLICYNGGDNLLLTSTLISTVADSPSKEKEMPTSILKPAVPIPPIQSASTAMNFLKSDSNSSNIRVPNSKSAKSLATAIKRKRKSLETIINEIPKTKVQKFRLGQSQQELTEFTPPFSVGSHSSNPILESLMKNPVKRKAQPKNKSMALDTVSGPSFPLTNGKPLLSMSSMTVPLQPAPGNITPVLKDPVKSRSKKPRANFKLPMPLPIPLPPGILNYTSLVIPSTETSMGSKPKKQRKPKPVKITHLNVEPTPIPVAVRDTHSRNPAPANIPFLPRHLEAFYRPINGAKDSTQESSSSSNSDEALDLCTKSQPVENKKEKKGGKSQSATKSLLKPLNVGEETPLNLVVTSRAVPHQSSPPKSSGKTGNVSAEESIQIQPQNNLENVKQMLARLHTKIAPAVNGVQLITIE